MRTRTALLTAVLALLLVGALPGVHGQEPGAVALPRLLPPVPQEAPAAPPVGPLTAPPTDFAEDADAEEAAPPTPTPVDPVEAVDTPVVPEAGIDVAVEEEPPVYGWYQPGYWFGPTPWGTSLELGINGSSGTSDSFSIRTGGTIDQESDQHKLAVSLYYNNTNAEGLTTQSNALLDSRRDWLFTNSAWSLFVLSQVYYDEFQAFDLNVNINGGLGYDLLKRDTMTLGASVGSGASREFGAPNEEWTPEAQFGLNYEQKVAGVHKVYAKVDYFPEWESFGNFRVLSDIGMEIELSRPSNMSLKISATDRYDSNPDGVPPQNTNYSVLLLWKL